MKSIFLKIIFITSLFFICNFKAQTKSDYIAFYNEVTPKLNAIVLNKTQFYGQNFSDFYDELHNKDINIVSIGIIGKTINTSRKNILSLYLSDEDMWKKSFDNKYQEPVILITFEDKISNEIIKKVEQYHRKWNNDLSQVFANMKIKKIEFLGLNGYDSSERSIK